MYRLTTALLVAWLSLPASAATPAARQSVMDLQPLLRLALLTGEARGVLEGPIVQHMAEQFGSREPILVDVKRGPSLPQAGCARMEVSLSQADVRERSDTGPKGPAQTKRIALAVSYCSSGEILPPGQGAKP